MVLFCNELQLQLANNINKTLMNIKARFALCNYSAVYA